MAKVKISRRRKALYFFGGLFLALWSWAYFFEPYRIEVTHHTFVAPIKKKVKIAHLTDLHIKSFGKREQLTLELVSAEKPDAIVITGDSVTSNGNYEAIGEFLKQLKAPLGVWLVPGNWDNALPPPDIAKFYTEAQINFLNNAHGLITPDIAVIGVDEYYTGNADIEAAMKGVPENAFKLGVFHAPKYFDLAGERFDVVLAGHTHGGQVRLPFLPPLWLPPGSRPYVEGWYLHSNLRTRMYVSRGIGNSFFNVRFFCRPELAILTLEPRP